MGKLTVFILFSAIMLTLMAVAIIPQMVVFEDESFGFFVKKNAKIGKIADSQTSCDLAAYGLDCSIAEYLEKNVAFTSRGGKNFCSYQILGEESQGNINYLYILCGEFYLDQGKIYEGSGTAGPAKIVKNSGEISVWRPRDGSLYTPDMEAEFPAQYRQMNSDGEKLARINRERAKVFFGADFDYRIEKNTDVSCSRDFDCVTPGEYLIMSRCPFTSVCIDGKCAVICPDFHNLD